MQLNDKRLFREQCYINGEWLDADNGSTTTISNPATMETLGNIPVMGAAETQRAIDAAEASMADWKSLTAADRSARIRRWGELMVENQDDLAKIMTLEQGKPLAEAKGEVVYAASFLSWFAEEGRRVYGDVIPAHQPDKRIIVLQQPIGVVAAITPWNFPAAMITRKAGAALAAGCSMVIKPAPDTPYSATALAELAERANIPAGVLNIVTGDALAIGGEMTQNPIVRKMTFTGSTAVGIKLMEQCAPTLKKMSLELGGNAPFIVFDDADIDAAVEGAMISKYRNAGQTCVCANRIYVQDAVYDKFAEKLTAAVKKLKVGNGMDDGVTTGPLINDAAVEKVAAHLEDALSKGGEILTGGKRHELGGTFFEPTIVVNADPSMRFSQEETFGPLAPLFRFKEVDDVIAMANDTQFGLASYFYANDLSRVWKVAEALDYGMVGINTGLISTEVAPFGGVKSSGLGREGSKYGIMDYMETKYLCMSV